MISIGNLQINKLYLGDVEVTKAYLGDVEVYGSTPTPPEPTGKYMTMTVLDGTEGTVISPTVTGSLPNLNLQYRVNNVDWMDFIVGTTEDIRVVAGDSVQFKGVNESGISTSDSNYLNFGISGNPVSLSGNIMSLIDGVGETLVIPNDYCFYHLFSQSNIKTVSSDFLPATEITKRCYQGIFYDCTNLVDAPIVLPAEVLKERCYSSMYSYCTNLVTVQDILPSKTLANGCYFGMYGDCYNLVTPPQLPATELCENCYSEMFYGCSKLAQSPVLNSKSLASYCYAMMFNGCSSLQYPPELPSEVVFNSCYYRMFAGCTSLVRCPELPAKVMAYNCYSEMFSYCTSIKNPPILHSTSLYTGCYDSMFEGCENLTHAPELPAEVLKEKCYEFMFKNCTSLENAPILPSTTLVNKCYVNMFAGCSKLSYVKSMATEGTINADGTVPLALTNWLKGVSSTGTFEKPAAAVYVTDSPGGIPQGWTVVNIDEPTQEKYMTMTVLDGDAGTTISPTVTGSLPNLNLQYRINNGDWTDFIVGTTADIKVVAGDSVQWKGMNTGGLSVDSSNYLNFAISGNPVALSGNIMSLIDGIGDALEIPGDYCFYSLFMNSNIKTVSSDFLPATTLTYACYRDLFNNCQNLTTAPVLPATNLIAGCYGYMFAYCNSLNYVKCLATEGITIPNALQNWLYSVAPTGTFVKPAGVTYETGVHGIPQGWTVEEI